MNIFSFDNTNNNIEYFFTKEHFIILLISLVIIIFFSMYATRQRYKFQKIFVIISTLLLIILEAGRIVWQILYLQHNSQSLTFLNVSNLNFFVLSLWLSIPVILITAIVKKDKKKSSFAISFVFSVSTIIAITNLIYPTFFNSNFEFYHIYNLTSILTRTLIIMLGFFFVCSKWTSTVKFLDLWRWFFSLVFFGMICIGLYFVLGNGENLFYLEYVPLFETLGIYLNFPFQFILIGIFIFAMQFLFFIPFYIHNRIKNY